MKQSEIKLAAGIQDSIEMWQRRRNALLSGTKIEFVAAFALDRKAATGAEAAAFKAVETALVEYFDSVIAGLVDSLKNLGIEVHAQG